MRTLSFILLSLVVYLAVIPCGDALAAEKPESFTSSIQADHQNHDNESHERDNCSSFCVCNCCQTRNFVPYISSDVTPSVNINKKLSKFNNLYHPIGVIDSIWRPPQFA